MSAATLEIPLVLEFDNRPANAKGSVPVVVGQDVAGPFSINLIHDGNYLVARPPLAEVTTGLPSPPTAIYAPSPRETYCIGQNRQVYYNSHASGTAYASLGSVSPGTNYVPGFAASSLVQNMMLCYGSSVGGTTVGYYRNGATFAVIGDADFTAYGALDSVACLDGTYYVVTAQGAIYGSALNDPSSWDPLNRINAWQDTSDAVVIFKHRSYIVVLKQSSMQVFYDAGNPVGSPLLPLLQAQQPVGSTDTSSSTFNPKTLVEIRGDHFWVARAQDNTVFVAQMSNLQITPVSTPGVNRWLDWNLRKGSPLQGTKYAFWGQVFYAISAYQGNSGTYGTSIVYNVTTKEWGFFEGPELADFNTVSLSGGFGDVIGPETYYTGFYGGSPRVMKFVQSPYTDFLGNPVNVTWSDTTVGNSSLSIMAQFTSRTVDGGTQAEKTAMRLEIFSDTVNGGMLEIAWSDDDYKTWSSYVSVPLNQPRVYVDDLGTFRRRAFRFRHLGPTPLRIERISLNVLVGVA